MYNGPSANLPLNVDVQALMDRFVKLQPVFSLDAFLSGWFHGSSIDVILRDNVEEFMAYAFVCKPLAQLCTLVSNFFPTTWHARTDCTHVRWRLYALP